MNISDAVLEQMITNCRILTKFDGPFFHMPADYKNFHKDWLITNAGPYTLVLNNVFHHPQGDKRKPKTILRIVKKEEKGLNSVTRINFSGTGIKADYVPVTTYEEIIYNENLHWLEQTGQPTVLIYHPLKK